MVNDRLIREFLKTAVGLVCLLFCFYCNAPAAAPDSDPAMQTAVPTPLTAEMAARLIELPLACVQQEYPNKLGGVIGGEVDLGTPRALHPAFYGCFDWHSSVHGHWSLVALLSNFPDLARSQDAKRMLRENITAENIATEVAYFTGKLNSSYERTYGWAWLLKLDQALLEWPDPLADSLRSNLQPLTELIAGKYVEFLPRLNYAIRTGEHPNTAFGLTFAYNYAGATDNVELKAAIETAVRRFYVGDRNCPLSWEPGGYDFLSPCLEEVDIVRRILPETEFMAWIDGFLPQLANPGFELPVGQVSDRTDGKLVHLDGLNFSRAWVLYGLARQYPKRFGHLTAVANDHVAHSLPNLVGDSYEGGHWLGSFAIYALGGGPVEAGEY